MNLGTTITKLRKERKITQGDLAEKCKITQAYLSMIENNKKEPNLSTLKELACALNVPLPVIFFLSIDKDDVPLDKQGMYDLVKPSVEGMIEKIFSL